MTKLLWGVILILFIISCENDATLISKVYPYLITENVIENDSTGATFSAKILDKGNEEIVDYGFILRDDNSEYKLSILNKSTLDDFHFKITTNLEKGKKYFYRAYIQTSKHNIQANEVTFISQGSTIPKIFGFTPTEGFDNTLVTIRGNGFGITKDNFKVYVHDIESEIIQLANDSIVFKTPKTSYSGDSKISIKAGSKTVIADVNYKILGPEIDSLSKREGHSGEYLTIWGKNFIQNGQYLEISFASVPAKLLTWSENRADLIIPIPSPILYDVLTDINGYKDFLEDKEVSIKLKNGLKVVNSDNFIIKKFWTRKQDPPFTQSGNEDCFVYNNKGYFFDAKNDRLLEYDPNLNTWSYSTTGYTGFNNQGCFFTVFGDKLFKLSGAYNYHDFWEYDFMTKNWLKRESTEFGFYQATSFILANTLFIVTDSKQVWSYNDTEKKFKRLNDFPETISLYFSFIAQDKAYLVNFGQTWEYNINNDSWSKKSKNPFQDGYYYKSTIGFSINGTCYVLQSGKSLYKYDMINDEWNKISLYPDRGQFFSSEAVYKSSFVIGEKAYIAALYCINDNSLAPKLFCFK